MSLPEQHLFSTAEVMQQLSVSKSTVRRLIESGQLVAVYPSKRTMRVTRESLEAHLARATSAGAVRASIEQGQKARVQAAKVAEQQHQEQQKKTLADRWGLGAIFGGKAG